MSIERKRIVFVGGGHAHLYSLKRISRLKELGAETTLVGPNQWHYYSGMGPGILSRIYVRAQARFNIRRLAESAGARFIQTNVTGIAPADQLLRLGNGDELSYDAVSFNVGSYVPLELAGAETENIFPVKPIKNMLPFQKMILETSSKREVRVLIVGGGAAGVELAGNAWRLVRSSSGKAKIVIVTAESELLTGLPKKARIIAAQSLSLRGIEIITGLKVETLNNGMAGSHHGKSIPFDIAALSTGIKPVAIFSPELATSDDGAMLVNRFLQSMAYNNIFGGGDCVTFAPKPLERMGVFAVRQAPVIFTNLKAYLQGKPSIPFRPQKRYVSIMNLGDGTGLLVRHHQVFHGKWAWIYKEFLDKSFAAKYHY